MAMCGMLVVSVLFSFPFVFLGTLCMPKIQGLRNNEKDLALSFGEVVALGNLAPCKTGTCGFFLWPNTQL